MTAVMDRTPAEQRGRSRSRCDCGGPCFFCGRALSRHRHEHDHFPVPFRHGGSKTVPSCIECHNLKDRLGFGLNPDGTPDEPLLKAVESGSSGMTCLTVNDERVPVIWVWLWERVRQPVQGDDSPLLLSDLVAETADAVIGEIAKCTTPEARIGTARLFVAWLDQLDAALQQGEGSA